MSPAALAQEHRLLTFAFWLKRGPSGMPAGDFCADSGRPTPRSISRSWDCAGLLREEFGHAHRYAIDVEGMRKLLIYLTEERQGRPRGEAFVAASKLSSAKGAVK